MNMMQKRTVLRHFPHWSASAVFRNEDDGIRLSLNKFAWAELGSPEEITLIMEPGGSDGERREAQAG